MILRPSVSPGTNTIKYDGSPSVKEQQHCKVLTTMPHYFESIGKRRVTAVEAYIFD